MKAEVLASVKLPLILAHPKGEFLDRDVFLYQGKDGGRILANAMVSPFSPSDGEALTQVPDSDVSTIPGDRIESFTKISDCPACEAELRASAEMASLLSGQKFHCISCGEEITANVIPPQEIIAKFHEQFGTETLAGGDGEDCDDDDTCDDDDDDYNWDDDDDHEEASVIEDPQDTPVEPLETAPVVPAAPVVAEPPKDTAVAKTTPVKADVEPVTPVEPTPVTPVEPAKTEPVVEAKVEPKKEIKADAEPTDKVAAPVEAPAEPVVEPTTPVVEEPKEQVLVPLTSKIDFKKDHIDLCKVGKGKTIAYLLVANGDPVAKMSLEKASKTVQPLFEDETAFVGAFIAAVADGPLSTEDETSFGFEPLHTQITVDQHVKDQIESARASVEAQVKEAVAQFKQTYLQSLSIATLGNIKGLWAGQVNPLREALIAKLSKVGVKSSDHLVDATLAEHSVDFFKMVMSKAEELSEKDVNFRNEMAKSVHTASFRTGVASTDSFETLGQHLAKGGIPVFDAGSSRPNGARQEPDSELPKASTSVRPERLQTLASMLKLGARL